MLRFLHTMIRVRNLEKSLHFYTKGMGFKLVSRSDHEDGRFTLAFLKAGSDSGPNPALIELTHNWDTAEYLQGNAFGHLAYQVESIDLFQKQLQQNGYDLSWGPGETPSKTTKMAFVDDPDGYEIELLEPRKGE